MHNDDVPLTARPCGMLRYIAVKTTQEAAQRAGWIRCERNLRVSLNDAELRSAINLLRRDWRGAARRGAARCEWTSAAGGN